MALDTNPTIDIDKEQIRIKEILDRSPNETDPGRSEQLAQIYIQEIDDFQTQLKGLEDVGLKELMKSTVLEFLGVAIDAGGVEGLSADLHTNLELFKKEIRDKKNLRTKANALLDSEEALAMADEMHAVEVEGVQLFRDQVAAENRALEARVTQMRKENEGWTGYAHAIEPSNLIASIGGGVNVMFGGEGLETKQRVDLESTAGYAHVQSLCESGMNILLKTMKGSESQQQPPMSLREAWQQLSSQSANFKTFRGSPDGRLFERTTLQNKEPTPNDRAQYLYDKGMAIVTYIGREEAEIYFQGLIQQFPDSPYAEKAKAFGITMGEKAYATFSKTGDIFLRLDMLALMAVMPAAGAVAARSALGLRTANLIAKYPQAAKLIPGVTALSTKGSKGFGLVSKTTGNLAVEVTKFMAYHQATEAIAGPEAAYAVGALCFFMPGLVHGFERRVGSKIDQYLAEEGEQGLANLMGYTDEAVGDPRLLREVFIRGLERRALAAGEKPNRALIEETVDKALSELSERIDYNIVDRTLEVISPRRYFDPSGWSQRSRTAMEELAERQRVRTAEFEAEAAATKVDDLRRFEASKPEYDAYIKKEREATERLRWMLESDEGRALTNENFAAHVKISQDTDRYIYEFYDPESSLTANEFRSMIPSLLEEAETRLAKFTRGLEAKIPFEDISHSAFNLDL